ncbi:MAG TPA: Rne/Rng family ribonuclease [Rhodoblastus sp.]|mgnify:CR=1 FL=1|nr:Rne/Rng family ribonuclease [Rhodoblastus sp.]
MANKMLIDASHPEETRVVVLRGNRVEEFDFESASKKPLRGNIYLAKVTRVEPSLQAAFVDYGGNRHGFLAFSEIHPDYYQIPVADRQALLEEEAASHADEEEEQRPRRSRRRRGRDSEARRQSHADETISEAAPLSEDGAAPAEGEAIAEVATSAEAGVHDETAAPAEGAVAEAQPAEALAAEPPVATAEAVVAEAPVEIAVVEAAEAPAPSERVAGEAQDEDAAHTLAVDAEGYATISETDAAMDGEEAGETPDHETKARRIEERDDETSDDEDEDEEEHVEQIGGDAMEEMPRRQPRLRRQYKIQEVIKRRQVLLVQVVKEERGNKGAALTTYLSLAGRYSVLMPNTARGGGISRKITDAGDRKRLKTIAQDLEVPDGMGVILRTAGASRTRQEVRRDFEYLMRMWETVRETTLRSSAPTLVYEEGSLIKRAIRDLYNKEVDEVVVSGETGFREAKDFMRLLMPSHARNVHMWREPQGVFVKSGVETQLDAMFSPQVTLKSGGYLVINQTEALVAIDVNSGRSTREHNIEDTALRTNLEAADEVARQLRLRDLAGLIVVDFIDMEEPRNNRAVERRLKDALKNDRARIQVGRISHFGLLEMSRQRIRTGVLEGSTVPCPHCAGAGTVRSTSSIALHVLRVLEEALIKSASHNIIVKTRTNVALYILNQKRAHLREIERRFGVEIFVMADDTLTGSTYHALERGEPATGTPEPMFVDPALLEADEEVDEADEALDEEDADEAAEAEGDGDEGEDENESSAEGRRAREERDEEGEDGQRRGRRRRRRRRGRGGEREGAIAADAPQPSDEGLAVVAEANGDFLQAEIPAERSGAGFWARENSDRPEPFHAPDSQQAEAPEPVAAAPAEATPTAETPAAEEPAPRQPELKLVEPAHAEAPVPESAPAEEPAPAVIAQPEPEPAPAPQPPRAIEQPRADIGRVITEADPNAPKKGGWWQRAKASITGN